MEGAGLPYLLPLLSVYLTILYLQAEEEVATRAVAVRRSSFHLLLRPSDGRKVPVNRSRQASPASPCITICYHASPCITMHHHSCKTLAAKRIHIRVLQPRHPISRGSIYMLHVGFCVTCSSFESMDQPSRHSHRHFALANRLHGAPAPKPSVQPPDSRG